MIYLDEANDNTPSLRGRVIDVVIILCAIALSIACVLWVGEVP